MVAEEVVDRCLKPGNNRNHNIFFPGPSEADALQSVPVGGCLGLVKGAKLPENDGGNDASGMIASVAVAVYWSEAWIVCNLIDVVVDVFCSLSAIPLAKVVIDLVVTSQYIAVA